MKMDDGGFKVPAAALGRRKKASEKIRSIDEHIDERKSKSEQDQDESKSEVPVGDDREVGAVLCPSTSSDRHRQNSDNNSVDRGATAAEPRDGLKGEIKDEDESSHDATARPVDKDSTDREGTPSSESDNDSSDSGRDGSSDKRSHDLSSRQRQAKSAESTSSEDGSVPRLPYTVPHWSGEPPSHLQFSLSIIKNGSIIDELDLGGKEYLVFGRLPTCDVHLEHPSISRYHAVLQYRPASQEEKEGGEGESENCTVFSTNPREPGYYVYDLGSTHGTYLNKRRLDQRCYYRVRVGQMVKFGGSSRLFLLESSGAGVQYEVEAEAEEERREITAQKEEYERKVAAAREEEERLAKERENAGVSWGIMMDDVPVDSGSGEEYEIDEEKEAYYKDDPKKALKRFFDREGLELEYEVEEEGPPKARLFTVRVRLPIDTVSGEAVAEASVKGKKKDAVLLCALNACRMLDAHDILRQPAKAHKRKKRNWEENDYYDSDEDTFLDRTGTIEKKRKKRMKMAGLLREEADSYDTLRSKLSETLKTIQLLEKKLRKDSQSDDVSGSVDSLDAYMSSVGDHLDKTKRSEIKHQLHELRRDEERLRKLVEVAKPTSLPTAMDSEHRTPEQATVTGQQRTAPKIEQDSPLDANKPMTSSDKPVTSSREQMTSINRLSPTKEEHSSSTNEIADVDSGDRPTRKLSQQDGQSEREGGVQKSSGRKRKRHTMIGPMLPPKQTTKQQDSTTQAKVIGGDPDYCDWMPPDYQTGDGKTHLNEKYGY